MATIERFEDLIAWQKARELARAIYETTNRGAFAVDFALRDQIRRSAISIVSKIAEGFERRQPTEFARYLLIAQASCGEVRSQLYIALDVGYLVQNEFDQLMEMARAVARLIGGLHGYVSSRRPNKSRPRVTGNREPETGN